MSSYKYTLSLDKEDAKFRCDVCGSYFEDDYYEMETENLCEKCFDLIIRDYYRKNVENLYSLDDFE